MGYLRYFVYFLSCAILGVFAVPCFLFSIFRENCSRDPLKKRLRKRQKQEVLMFFMKGALKVQPWIQYKIDLKSFEALEKSHKGGVLFVANHRSYFDVHILVAEIRGVQLLGRRSLLKVPFLGFFMKQFQQITAEKGNLTSLLEATRVMEERLDQGERVLVFPEMTRCEAAFKGVQKFQSLPFQSALKKNVPIVPLCIHNSDAIWSKGSSKINRGQTIFIESLEPILPSTKKMSAVECGRNVRQKIEEILKGEI